MKKWSEEEIERYVNSGWSLSYDKKNLRYKLQKRIRGKVKSYSLPKKFNEFCEKLKGEIIHGRTLSEYFKVIENEKPLIYLALPPYNLKWDEIDTILREYCKRKAKELTPEQVAEMTLYIYKVLMNTPATSPRRLTNLIQEHKELEIRVADILQALSKKLGMNLW